MYNSFYFICLLRQINKETEKKSVRYADRRRDRENDKENDREFQTFKNDIPLFEILY